MTQAFKQGQLMRVKYPMRTHVPRNLLSLSSMYSSKSFASLALYIYSFKQLKLQSL